MVGDEGTTAVTVTVPECDPEVAVKVIVPAATALTGPVKASTVATVSSPKDEANVEPEIALPFVSRDVVVRATGRLICATLEARALARCCRGGGPTVSSPETSPFCSCVPEGGRGEKRRAFSSLTLG